MKPWPLSFIAILLATFLFGCADPLEKTTGNEVGSRLEKGVTGHGELTDRDSLREPGDAAAAHGIPSRP